MLLMFFYSKKSLLVNRHSQCESGVLCLAVQMYKNIDVFKTLP